MYLRLCQINSKHNIKCKLFWRNCCWFSQLSLSLPLCHMWLSASFIHFMHATLTETTTALGLELWQVQKRERERVGERKRQRGKRAQFSGSQSAFLLKFSLNWKQLVWDEAGRKQRSTHPQPGKAVAATFTAAASSSPSPSPSLSPYILPRHLLFVFWLLSKNPRQQLQFADT